MKRWVFDALTYQHRKQLIGAGGLKNPITPTVLYNVLAVVIYGTFRIC